MSFDLRAYQIQAIQDIRNSIVGGCLSNVLVVPTGGGKTIIASEIVKAAISKKSPVLFCVHRIELVKQTLDKLAQSDIYDVGLIKAGYSESLSSPIQIASVQTLTRRLDRMDLSHFKLAIFDEAHHARADTWQAIINALPPGCIIIGLTATPMRADGKGLGTIFGHLIPATTVDDLIRQGYLVPSVTLVAEDIDLSNVKVTAGDYNKKQLQSAMNRSGLIQAGLSAWKQHAIARRTIVFASGVEHSKALAAAFVADGFAFKHLDGTTPDDERQNTIDELQRGILQGVTNCDVLTEGFDCPAVDCILDVAPTRSRGKWIQKWGRGLRTFPGKTDCIMLDLANACILHGFLTDPTEFSLKNGVRAGEGPKFSCPHCHAKFIGWPKYCPQCGYELPRGERDAHKVIDIHNPKLVEIDKKDPRYQQKLYDFLQNEAHAKGYKPGYADYKFKQRIGMWPPKSITANAPFATMWIRNPETGAREKIWLDRSTTLPIVNQPQSPAEAPNDHQINYG